MPTRPTYISSALAPVATELRLVATERIRLSSTCCDLKESLTLAREEILQQHLDGRTEKMRSAMKQCSKDIADMAEQRRCNEQQTNRMRVKGQLKT